MNSDKGFTFKHLPVEEIGAGMHVYAKSRRGLVITAWVQSVTKTDGSVERIVFRDAGHVEVRAPHFADLEFFVVEK